MKSDAIGSARGFLYLHWRSVFNFCRSAVNSFNAKNDSSGGSSCAWKNFFKAFWKRFSDRQRSANVKEEIMQFPILTPAAINLDCEYDMSHQHRGIAMITNHENFSIPHLQRKGTDKDRDRLRGVLQRLGFETRVFENLCLASILDELQKGLF